MGNMFAILLSLGLVVTPTPKMTARVSEITETDRAVVEVCVDRGYQIDAYIFDFPVREDGYEAYIEDAHVGKNLNPKSVYGTFRHQWREGKEIYYQFESYDGDCIWVLTEAEMGFVPTENKPYVLVYDDNKDTKKTHKCPEEYECDCYTYDDLFLGVYDLR